MTNEAGSTLLIVLLTILLFTGLIVGVVFEPISGDNAYSEQNGRNFSWGQGWLGAVHTDARHTSRKIKHTAALYLAEAGIEHAKQWLSSQSSPPAAPATIPSTTVLGASSVNLGSGSYTAQIVVAAGAFGVPYYTITSTGTAVDNDPNVPPSLRNVKRTIVAKAMLGSFARYAYFTNSEPSNLWFITQDALLGLVHTNGSFHIAGKPDFWGLTTSCGSQFTFYNNGNSITTSNPSNGTTDVPNFRNGYQLSAPTVSYPTATTDMQSAAQGSTGIVINSDCSIALSVGPGNVGQLTYTPETWTAPNTHTHSWVGWHNGIYHSYTYSQTHTHPGYYTATGDPVTTSIYDSATNPAGKAIVYVNGSARVSGTLAGQLTILTEKDLAATGDILYRINPVDYDNDGLLSDANGNGVNDPWFDRNGDGLITLSGEKADDTDDNGDGISDIAACNQPESTDTLGLVAKRRVVVADDGTTSPTDRTISGTVMAIGITANPSSGSDPFYNGSYTPKTGTFSVEHYNDDDRLEGSLTLIGGLIQKERGAVGTFSGNFYDGLTITSGYSKNYIYDQRLLYYPPPYFPPAKTYDLIYWQEQP